MKRSILIMALCAMGLAASAQAPQPKEDTLHLAVPASRLINLREYLRFSYNWLETSDAKARDVKSAKKAIEDMYPLLVPMEADTTKRVVVSLVDRAKGK